MLDRLIKQQGKEENEIVQFGLNIKENMRQFLSVDKEKDTSHISAGENRLNIFKTQPVADLFLNTTVMVRSLEWTQE